MKLPGIIKNLLLLLFGLFISFIILELTLRVYRGQLFDTTHLSSEYAPETEEDKLPRAQYDKVLGWIPNFGTREAHRWNSYIGAREKKKILYTIKRDGIRSNGTGSLKTGNSTNTILAVGDSFTFGEDVNDDETWPAQLQKLTSTRVINGGVFNYGFDQTILRAEILARRYRPRLLIVSFIPHDIIRCEMAVKGQAKPYFTMDAGALTLRNVPVPLPPNVEYKDAKTLFKRIFGYSHLVDFIMRRININYWLNHRIVLVDGNHSKKSTRISGVEVACALMERLVRLGNELEMEVMILAQYGPSLKADYRAIAEDVIKCAHSNKIKVLDLFPSLKSIRTNNLERYRSLYIGHMTAEGNFFVANEIYNFLRINRAHDK